MVTIYEYDEIDILKSIIDYEDIKNISMDKIFFQLDYIGFIRGDILMKLIPQKNLISFIINTQYNFGIYTQISNMYVENLKMLSVSEDSYKKIMMCNTDNLGIDEYIIVEINDELYCGTRLYPSFCFIKK